MATDFEEVIYEGQDVDPMEQHCSSAWVTLVAEKVCLTTCLLVLIGGSSLMTIGCFSSNDPRGKAGAEYT